MIFRFTLELFTAAILPLALGLFVMLGIVAEAGFRLGRRHAVRRPPGDREMTGISALTGGMLGLMAFVLAVTIGFAQDRFEARRATMLTEANTIGTAWLRTNLAGPAGKPVAGLIEDYARVRLSYIQETSPNAIEAALARTNTLQNDMFDANLSQRFALESRVPLETMLGLLCGAVLAIGALGFQVGLTGKRHPLLGALLIGMLTGGMMLVVDLSRARLGFMRVDTAPLDWTLQGFTPGPKK